MRASMQTSMTLHSLLAIVVFSTSLAACGNGSGAGNAHEAAVAGKTSPAAPEHPGRGRVTVTAGQVGSADIGLAVAGPGFINEHLSLYGVISPDAERVLEVAARYPGVVHAVTKRVGDAVKAGESLAIVESNESLQTYRVLAPLSGVVTARATNPGEQTGEKALFT